MSITPKRKLTTAESRRKKKDLPDNTIIYSIQTDKHDTLVPPPPHSKAKWGKNSKVFVKKDDRGPAIPGTEPFTPNYLQEPVDPVPLHPDPFMDLELRLMIHRNNMQR